MGFAWIGIKEIPLFVTEILVLRTMQFSGTKTILCPSLGRKLSEN